MRHRFTAGLLATTIGASLLAVGTPAAHASSKGRKNTSLGLGAVAIYELLRGNTTTGLLASAGTLYAYKRYRDERNNERRYGRYYGRNGRSRSYRTRYRTTRNDGGFRFPDSGYYGNGYGYPSQSGYSYGNDGYYGNGGYQYQNGGYSGSGGYYQNDSSYCPPSRYSDDRYRRSRYDDYDRVAGYRSQQDGEDRPRGWSHGRKRGWRGESVPPGHWRRD